jgi:hypothetical protein
MSVVSDVLERERQVVGDAVLVVRRVARRTLDFFRRRSRIPAGDVEPR